jgi:hypothetical protein
MGPAIIGWTSAFDSKFLVNLQAETAITICNLRRNKFL